jgi:hypothetical protein
MQSNDRLPTCEVQSMSDRSARECYIPDTKGARSVIRDIRSNCDTLVSMGQTPRDEGYQDSQSTGRKCPLLYETDEQYGCHVCPRALGTYKSMRETL